MSKESILIHNLGCFIKCLLLFSIFHLYFSLKTFLLYIGSKGIYIY